MEAVLNPKLTKVTGIIPVSLTRSELNEVRQEKNDDAVWLKIRSKLINNMFKELGINEEQFKVWKTLLEKNPEGKAMTPAEIIKQTQEILNQAKTTVKAGDRDVRNNIIGLGMAILAAVVAPVGIITSLSAYVIGKMAFTTFMMVKRRVKNRKNDIADAEQKEGELIEMLKDFVPRVQSFINAIEQGKPEFLEKKKTLKPKEFKVYLVTFIERKMKEYGLAGLEVNKSSIVEKYNKETGANEEEQDKKQVKKNIENDENQLGK